MKFKLEEVDGIDDEILDHLDGKKDDEYSDNDEFDPLGYKEDENENEDDAESAVQVSDELVEEDDRNEEEDEATENTSSLILGQTLDIAPFNEQEEDNLAYIEAINAYYKDNNYEHAIEKFGEVIKSENRGAKKKKAPSNGILAKSIYWQGEAYVKTQDIEQAIKTFESLVKTCTEHYLSIAAQRRVDTLRTKNP